MAIPPGTYILLYHSEKDHHLIRYEPGGSFGTRKGQIVLPSELSWGEILYSSKHIPFFVLRPNWAELTLKVQRKTTILYPKDMGWMVLHSTIGEGSTVLECGSGSGAMTLLLALLVGDRGKVYSFERREDHLTLAMENLKKHSLLHRVVFHQRDPAEEGFPDICVENAIIDVPEPWTLVRPVHRVLEGGGHWLSLSPTYNQVEKTVKALEEGGFAAIQTVEIFERRQKVRTGKTRPTEWGITHTGFVTSARKVIAPLSSPREA